MTKRVRILAIIFAMVLLAALSSKGAAPDPNLPDSVTVDSVSAFVSGTQAIVPVNFFNDEKLSSVEVTLKIGSSSVKVDSFSFGTGRASAVSIRGFQLNEDSSIVDVYFLVGSGAPMAAGTGLLGNLYLHWPSTVSSQLVALDSVSWVNNVNVLHTTTFIDTLGGDFVPRFKPGHLNVLADPPRYDSLWVADVQANIGAQTVVDVGLFNSQAVAGISLALTWESGRLNFDSISYDGARGASAPSRSLQKNNSAKELLATIAFDPGTPLASGSGMLARLYFSVPASAPETTVTIDSTSYLGSQSTYLLLTPASGSLQFTPIFHRGSIELKAGTGVNDGGVAGLPKKFSLGQNYPNPFNPSTEIQFSLPKSSQVRLDVYNILGGLVRTLVDRRMDAGVQRITFDGKSESGRMLASGVYFYRLSASDFTETRKMILLK